jgi:hypothetical protein
LKYSFAPTASLAKVARATKTIDRFVNGPVTVIVFAIALLR